MREILINFIRTEIGRIFYMTSACAIGGILFWAEQKEAGLSIIMLVAGAVVTRFRTPRDVKPKEETSQRAKAM
jgi:hypothetical protein